MGQQLMGPQYCPHTHHQRRHCRRRNRAIRIVQYKGVNEREELVFRVGNGRENAMWNFPVQCARGMDTIVDTPISIIHQIPIFHLYGQFSQATMT